MGSPFSCRQKMKTGKIEEIRIEEIEEMETDTMSKLEKVFDTPNKKAFIGFLTAGDPDADSTCNLTE